MTNKILLLPVVLPLTAALIAFFMPRRVRGLKNGLALLGTLLNLILAVILFKSDLSYSIPWAGLGFDFALRIYHFSAFIILAAGSFGFLIALYSIVSLRGKDYSRFFYLYLLISLAFINGAVLADNLVVLLFFWEGLLLTIFGMIAMGHTQAFKTATKAFIILGSCDLALMVGIVICGHIGGTLAISKLSIPVGGMGALAFFLMMIGAVAKAGSMPFHSWIPDAALDAPLPFMAIFPAALEKLVGIYFLTRISLDIFQLKASSWLSYLLMTIGALTILLAVMMALVQKDFKKLLSYHAISQVGYMILGIGTLTPVGIVGGLFHMINNALYKSCLFLTGGAVEKEAGTTDLQKLGGIGSRMPITFACFIITALSISGVPPFNGFFSKELVYDGALERGWIFYFLALAGSFFTAASFLKLGHAAFLGKISEDNKNVKEAPLAMLIPMIVIASTCVLFGIYNALPIKLIQPILGPERIEGHDYAGFPPNLILVTLTLAVLISAFLNHVYGVTKMKSGLKAVDHIRYAPLLADVYDRAEKKYFDPYNIGLKITNAFSICASWFDKAIDWVYNDLIVKISELMSVFIRQLHDGSYKTYMMWSLAAAVFIAIFLIKTI